MGLYRYVTMLVYYQLISIPTDINIKLISDLGHIKLVWYLIPMLILTSILAFEPIYHSNIDT
jgi:hypothetical protein